MTRTVDVVPAGAERRTGARVELEIEVGLETDTNFYTGLTQDISTGGLFVATHNIRSFGEHLTVKFSLPGSATPLVVEAEVRWIKEITALNPARHDHHTTGMGLKFLNLSAQNRIAITKFLERRESLFYDDD